MEAHEFSYDSVIDIVSTIPHLPVIFFLAVLCYQVYRTFDIYHFKLIAIGWSLNFLLLSLGFVVEFDDGVYIFTNSIGSKILHGVSLFLDISSSYFFLVLPIKNDNKYTRLITLPLSRIKTAIFLMAIFLIIILTYFYFDGFEIVDTDSDTLWYEYIIRLITTIIGFVALFRTAYYFVETFPKVRAISILFKLTMAYAILQLAHIISLDKLDVVWLFNSASLICKAGILFGIHEIFAHYSLERVKVADAIDANNELNKIFGRTFHELAAPLNALNKQLGNLTENISEKRIGRDAYKELFESYNNYHRIIAVVTAAMKRYESKIGSDFNGEVFKIPEDQKIEANNINTLAEIAIISIKDFHVEAQESFDIKRDYGGNCNVICKPSYIVQVIYNIIKNSLESFVDFNGKVIIKTRIRKRKELNSDLFRKYVILEIADTGSGIPEDVYTSIFKEGFSTKKVDRDGQSRGYGMSIVESLTKITDGQIEVESPYDFRKFNVNSETGTLVRLIFPTI